MNQRKGVSTPLAPIAFICKRSPGNPYISNLNVLGSIVGVLGVSNQSPVLLRRISIRIGYVSPFTFNLKFPDPHMTTNPPEGRGVEDGIVEGNVGTGVGVKPGGCVGIGVKVGPGVKKGVGVNVGGGGVGVRVGGIGVRVGGGGVHTHAGAAGLRGVGT